MTSPYRPEPFDLTEPAGESQTAQAYVTRALARLEADFRSLALLALADWEQLDIAEHELFGAVGSLLRPSWGSWNFVLQSLRNARKAQLRGGRSDVRERIEGARILQAVLTTLDANASEEACMAARPLAQLLGDKARLKRVSDVLVLPISLRNQIAHFPPTEEHEWEDIRTALVPLMAWHVSGPIPLLGELREWPEPWFVLDDGRLWALNGVEQDHAPSYAALGARPRAFADRAAPLRQAIQRLLGRTEQQDGGFRRLLARLAPDDLRGVIIGDFLVGAPVAKGGFASVHLSRQLSTGRKVAVKLLHDGLGEDARQRFQQEAGYLSRVNDPAVVGVISHGEEAWSLPRFVDLKSEPWFQELAKGAAIKTFIALEWIDGRTLEEVFQAAHVAKCEPLPAVDVVREWFRESARALAAVHAAGLIHRDIKPGNLMVDQDGRIRLMDFGIARSDDENRTLMTSTGYALGTPPYMAPEQIRAHDADAEVGPPADIYSLCATFYELATGQRVFHHDRESAETVKTRKLSGELPPAPRHLVKGLPWELETVLLGGLQPELVDRYQSAGALANDLERWVRDEPLEYKRPGLARRLTLAYRRNRALTNVVASALALAVVGTTLYIASIQAARRREERASAQTTQRLAIEQASAGQLASAVKLVAELPASTRSHESDLLVSHWAARLETPESALASAKPPFVAESLGETIVVIRPNHGFKTTGGKVQLVAPTRDGRSLVLVLNVQRTTVVALLDVETLALRRAVELDDFTPFGLFQAEGQGIAVVAGVDSKRAGFDMNVGVVFDLASGTGHVMSHFMLADDCRYVAVDTRRGKRSDFLILATEDLLATPQRARASVPDADVVRFDGSRLDLRALRFLPQPGSKTNDIDLARAAYQTSTCQVAEIARVSVPYPAERSELADWTRWTFSGGIPRAWFDEDDAWVRSMDRPETLDVVPRQSSETDDDDSSFWRIPPVYFDQGRNFVELRDDYSGMFRFLRLATSGAMEKTTDVVLGYQSDFKISPDQRAVYVPRSQQDVSFSVVLPEAGVALSPLRAPVEPPPGRLAAFTSDGAQLVALDDQGLAWRWSVQRDRLIETAQPRFVARPGPDGVLAIAAFRDGGLLLASSHGRLARVAADGSTRWSVTMAARKEDATLQTEDGELVLASLELSSDERFVVAVHGRIVQLFSTVSGAPLTAKVDLRDLCRTLWTELPADLRLPVSLNRLSYCDARTTWLHARVSNDGEVRVSAGEYTYVRRAPQPVSRVEIQRRIGSQNLFGFARPLLFDAIPANHPVPAPAFQGTESTHALPLADAVPKGLHGESVSEPALSGFTVQISAFAAKSDADELVSALRSNGVAAEVSQRTVYGRPYFRVRVGAYATLEEATDARAMYEEKLGGTPIVMKR